MVRRSLLVLALCATLTGALGGAAHASSVPPPPYRPGDPQLYTSAHFASHYDGDPAGHRSPTSRRAEPPLYPRAHFPIRYDGDPAATDYITQVQAGALASYLEQAYT